MALCHMTGYECVCTAPQLCRNFRAPAPEMDPVIVLEPDGFFRAIDRNNYDVDCDHTGFFSKSPTGYGRTPLDAIVDLLDNAYGSPSWEC